MIVLYTMPCFAKAGMYVRMHACMYVCMYVYRMYDCAIYYAMFCKSRYVCMNVCMYVSYVCMYVCIVCMIVLYTMLCFAKAGMYV